MPGFNQTGPLGQGSMTGRRMGKCTNYAAFKGKPNVVKEINKNEVQTETSPIENNQVYWGRCLRRGRNLGLGRQNRFRGRFE